MPTKKTNNQTKSTVNNTKNSFKSVKYAFNCQVCSNRFPNQTLFINHYTSGQCKPHLAFKCGQCSMSFKDKKQRLDHVLHAHMQS